ncbi:MAG: polysaccharide biosynthesis protein [Hyphomicrobiaceae bacterium]|nr:polysaccharide biosynthesis protein [Hyphomicrobiaceae bacterium]
MSATAGSIGELASLASRRTESLFSADLDRHGRELSQAVRGSRILVIGAAGSIGSEVVRVLAELRPKALHALDLSENGLVEVVRDLRSRGIAPEDFRSLPLDFGDPSIDGVVDAYGPYDTVLSFAAIKHVRSEKDAFSLARMLDINVARHDRLLTALARGKRAPSLIFYVSTDKAANPVSLMGASKRFMEHVVFARQPQMAARRGSARFANVSFSAGSLLEGFLHRLAKRQPLAAPAGIRRYFVSPREAAELSVLSAYVNPAQTIGIPRLDPDEDLVPMDVIAERVLAHHGYKAYRVSSEDEARRFPVGDGGRWPLLITPGDTAGEKPYEEFVGSAERLVPGRLSAIQCVAYQGPPEPDIAAALGEIEAFIAGRKGWRIADAADIIRTVVPELAHISSDQKLDDRM